MSPSQGPILVTGADGGLGRAVLKRLRDAGEPVVAMGRRAPDVPDDAVRFTADITDTDAVRTALSEVQPAIIIHLAGITGGACDVDRALATATNTAATATLAHIAAECGVARFVFTSSAAVYGDGYSRPIAETDTLRGTSTYALTKITAEEELRKVAQGTQLSVVALRIFNVYGPGFTSSLVNRLMASSAVAPVRLTGLDEFVRDYIHADDVAGACVAAAFAHLPDAFTPINVATGVATSNATLLATARAHHEPAVTIEPGTANYSVADTSLMRATLGLTTRALLETA